MNIAHFINAVLPIYYYGGMERVIIWLLEALSGMGHKNFLLAPPGTACPYAEVIPVDRVKRITEASPDLEGKIPSSAEILHYHDGYSYKDYGVPMLKTIHGYAWLNKELDRNFNFVSDAQRRVYKRPDLPFVLNGLNPQEYIFSEEKEEFFLFLSKVDWKVKGLHWAVKAAKRAGVKLIIAGNSHRKFVEGYFHLGYLKRHFNHNCLYIGEIGGMIKNSYLARAKALIFPTQWEDPCPVVTLEAMVSGTPVITTHRGAMPELVVDKKTGFLCDTVDEMVEAIRRVNDIDPHECRNHVLEHFTHERMAQEYVELYKKNMV